ncbi:hypothetical protein GCM10010218_48490 [Streptomyces mashuensis]|uniref:Uncharacterized protein n=1 Tax=Streptomyces mashuensis TaxID=33904 RepID=A0A919EE42_9ACTN|nr:hypothetical protein GCM10010218_48490 [Streptomyces mashuensis]
MRAPAGFLSGSRGRDLPGSLPREKSHLGDQQEEGFLTVNSFKNSEGDFPFDLVSLGLTMYVGVTQTDMTDGGAK